MKKKVFFMKKIRLMLVDDHTLMRDGLKTIFEIEDDFEIVGFASNGREAYEEALKLKPDIILMDIRMEEMNGVNSTKIIKEKLPKTIIIILTTFDDDEYIIDALSYGASGYLLKDLPADQLIKYVRDSYNGRILMPDIVAKKIANNLKRHKEDRDEAYVSYLSNQETTTLFEELSKREVEIAKLLIKGLSNKQIADNLYLSEGTVKNYISNIYGKIGSSSRVEAVIFLSNYFNKTGKFF